MSDYEGMVAVVDDVKGLLGVDISEDGSNSEELREAEVPILAKCGRSYNNILYQIFGKDACQGDNWYLGEVISHG